MQSSQNVLEKSYARCLAAEDFVPRLYEHFLACDPAIPPYFEHTVFPRQYKVLKHGLGLLVSFSKNPDPELLDRIAARHSARGIDVPPEHYELFVRSLLKSVEEHDPEYDAETEAAWRAAVQPGLDFMRARYDR
jgi:hemoglobin-like flavoprotein